MAALRRNPRALHTGHAAADDCDLLGRFGGDKVVHFFLTEQVRVNRALLGQPRENVSYAAEVAADTWANLLVEPKLGLVGPLGVCQQLTAEHHGGDLAILYGVVRHLWLKNLAAGYNRDVYLGGELAYVVEPETFLLVHRRVEPVEAVIGAVAEIDCVVARLGKLLGDVDALLQRAAILGVIIALNAGLAGSLYVLPDAEAAGDGEVLPHGFLDALDYFAHPEDAAVQPAVFVGALVEAGLQELVGQVAAVAVDVHTVAAGLYT